MKRRTEVNRPRVGVIGLAYPGYNLGEEMCAAKLAEALSMLRRRPVDITPVARPVLDEAGARQAGEELAKADVDCILTVITTFVPDYFLTELLDRCPVPVFLWAVEREMQCIALVCGPLITASLYNLGRHYHLAGADFGDAATLSDLEVFARAAMLGRVLRTMRVGYCGGKCPIMFSLTADEYALKRILGTTVVTLPVEEFHDLAAHVRDDEAAAGWRDIKVGAGAVTALEADGLKSTRYYLAARRLAERHGLDALSLNCFPHLKSQICLGVAKLNDDGIAAACEGDLHSTILMSALARLSGRTAFNGDWLRMYPETNEVLFSHCGAGAFSLAASLGEVCLRCSIETHDGLAVCYATQPRGPVTLANLMLGNGDLRLAALCGESVPTDTEYEGTPLRVRFRDPVKQILQRLARCGAGHHWNGGFGDFMKELTLLCEWRGLMFNRLDNDSNR